MYALRKDVSMHGIKQYMTRAWNFIQLSNIYYNKEGYFIMRFTSLGDKEKVLTKGPYIIFNVPMILRDLSYDFNFKRDSLRILPIWFKLPQLPLHLWEEKSLGKIGSVIA